MRLVLDTAAIVAAVRSDQGASRFLLRSALERKPNLTLLVTVPLLLEYEAVLMRAEHLKAGGIGPVDVGILLDAVAAVAEPVRLAFLWRPQLADVNDDMVLEAAVNGNADGIATFNLKDFRPAADRFGISIWTPRDALAQLRIRR